MRARRGRRILSRLGMICSRAAVLAFILFVTGYALFQAEAGKDENALFRLQRIEFEGALHLQTQPIEGMIQRTVPANLLAIDLDRVRALVESEPWVRHAVVRRKLPDRLQVSVTERTPEAVAAIDEELYVVDAEGVILDGFGPDYTSIDRPIVKGLRSTAREDARQENARRMSVYLAVIHSFQSAERDYAQTISEIHVDDPHRVSVVPADEPVQILLGETDFAARFRTFLSQKELFFDLREKYGEIEYVDVTYDNKIIFHTPQQPPQTVATNLPRPVPVRSGPVND